MTLKFADLVSATIPRAGKSPGHDGPRRIGLATKLTSGKATATMSGAKGGKVGRSGNKTQTGGSRFAHFARSCDAGAAQAASEQAAVVRPGMQSLAGLSPPERLAALRRGVAAGFRTEQEIAAENGKSKEMAEHAIATAKRLGVIK